MINAKINKKVIHPYQPGFIRFGFVQKNLKRQTWKIRIK